MKDFLPVGSVVRLKGIEKRLVVAGVFQVEANDETKIHDYVGNPYPEGFLGREGNILFDEGDIEEVCFRGYEDEERTEFIKLLNQAFEVLSLEEELKKLIADDTIR